MFACSRLSGDVLHARLARIVAHLALQTCSSNLRPTSSAAVRARRTAVQLRSFGAQCKGCFAEVPLARPRPHVAVHLVACSSAAIACLSSRDVAIAACPGGIGRATWLAARHPTGGVGGSCGGRTPDGGIHRGDCIPAAMGLRSASTGTTRLLGKRRRDDPTQATVSAHAEVLRQAHAQDRDAWETQCLCRSSCDRSHRSAMRVFGINDRVCRIRRVVSVRALDMTPCRIGRRFPTWLILENREIAGQNQDA